MSKALRFLGVIILFSLFPIGVFAEDAPSLPSHGRSDLAFGLEFKFTQNFLVGGFGEARDLPLALRQVPSHPDDTWIYGSSTVIRTIPLDSYALSEKATFIPAISPEITINRFRLRAGLNLTLVNSVYTEVDSLREINQYGGTERGIGTSLVYYKVMARSDHRPGLLTEAEFEIGKGFSILGGSDVNYYKIVLESGWDRWDKLEKYKAYDLSKNKMRKIYGGIEIQPARGDGNPVGFHVLAGKVKDRGSITGEGAGTIIRRDGDWFVSFGISIHTVFLKNNAKTAHL